MSILHVRAVSKTFPGVKALSGVSMNLERGEVHCLVGENGAGKSTLIKVLVGLEKPDSGEILVDGKSVAINNAADASRLGIAFVPQELTLLPDMTVAENIFLGRMPKARFSLVDFSKMKTQAQNIVNRVGLDISVDKRVRVLQPAEMQLCQIARALFFGARFIILDEPTAALGVSETENLFKIIRQLCEEDVSFIYVTHRLDEIPLIGQRLTVLRDGHLIDTCRVSAVSKTQIIEMMVGAKMSATFERSPINIGEPVLEVNHLTRKGVFEDVTFSIRRGEIVGIFGLLGAKRTDVLRSIMGLDRIDSGTIRVHGQKLEKHSPPEMKRRGVALIPEERRQQALALEQSVRENLSVASLQHITQRGITNTKKEKAVATSVMDRLRIRTNKEVPVKLLSGGNQQKVVIGRWLLAQSKLFLVDEPTRGIDVGARSEIYQVLDDITNHGGAVLMVSSDLEEVMGVSDRIIVMKGGRIVGEFQRSEVTAQTITACAFG